MASTQPAASDASFAALIPLGTLAGAPPVALKRPVLVIGARKDIVGLHLQSSTVSNAHCVVVLNGWGCYVHDLGSRTGTLVNGKPVTDADLADGDVVHVGRFQFRYRAPQKVRPKPLPLPPADLAVSTLPAPLVANKRVLVVGRRVGSDVQLADSQVSNVHAIIVEQDGRRLVRDLKSRTGTWLDEKPVHQEPLPDGEAVRVGGATVTITERGTAGIAAPVTLADAAPQAAAGLDAPAASDDLDFADVLGLDLPPEPAAAVGVDSIDEIDLDAPPIETESVEIEPADTLPPGDDLAALRRDWKAPPRPVDEVVPKVETQADAKPARRPAPGRPRPTPPAAPLAPAPVAPVIPPLIPLILDDATHTPPAPPAALATPVPPAGPVAEVPAIESVAPVADGPETIALDPDFDALELDEAAPAVAALPTPAVPPAEPVTPAAIEVDEIEADTAEPVAELAVPLEPAVPDVEADVEADAVPADAAVDVDAFVLDEAAPAVADVPAEADEIAATPAVSEPTPVAEIGEVESFPPDPESPVTAETGPVDVDALRADPEAPEVEVSEVEAPEVEVSAIEAIDIQADHSPADAALSSEDDADEKAMAVEASTLPDEMGVGHGVSDTVAAVSDTSAAAEDAAETPWVSATETADVAVSDTPTPAAGDLVDLRADLDEAEPGDITAGGGALGATQLDTADLVPPTAAEASADTVAERPGVDGLAGSRFAGAGVLGDATLDVDIGADVDAADEPLSLDDLNDWVVGHDPEAKADGGPVAETPAIPDIAEPVPPAVTQAFITPAEPKPAEAPDLVRLTEDAAEDENEATALAVDLGLVLDDELGTEPPLSTVPAAGPAGPVDIDLAAATPHRPEAVDLSQIGQADEATFRPYDPAAATPAGFAPTNDLADDVFDADDVEVIDDVAPPAPVRPAAESPDRTASDAGPNDETSDDHDIAPPGGGSLADLMPSGPPLLGGSFMSLPPMMPPEPTAPGGRRRPLRVGFGQEQRPARNAPFAADRTIANAMGDADVDAIDDELDGMGHGLGNGVGNGLAGGLGQSRPAGPTSDAFSSAPITAANGDGLAEAAPADRLLVPTERFRPRGVIRPVVPATAADDGDAAAVYVPGGAASAVAADASRAQKHKRRVRRVIACVVAMVLLAGGAAWGVYYYTPLKSTVDALISYEGLDRLGAEEANQFRVRQNAALLSEPVRTGAITSLPPTVPAGFLSDSKKLFETVVSDPKVRWPAEQATVMRLRVRSTDKENDVTRLRALAAEVVKAGDADRATIEKTKELIREDSTEISEKRRQLVDLKVQLDALEQKIASKPDVKNLSELNAEYLAAEPALTAIKSKRQELEATIETLQRVVPVIAAAPAADPASVDQELTSLNKQLADLQQTAKPAADNGVAARKELDATIARFDEELAKAQKLRENPELATYFDAVKRMFTQTRQMTEALIRRQETTQTRLSELKAALYEKMQARTEEQLNGDTELKKLRDTLAILTRKYNSAKGDGLLDDAKKLELDLRLVNVKIGEREDQFRNDPVYGPMITGLQRVIDAGEAEIRTDRKNSNDSLTALQADFMKSAPAVEKLPAEQKALVEGIEQRRAAMNEARRAYAAAAETAQAAQAKAEADGREKAAALRLQIAARRQDVIAAAKAREVEDDAATRQTKLAAVQKELIEVRAQEQAAQHRLADAGAAIDTAERARRALTLAETERQAKRVSQATAERELNAVLASANARQAQIARLIVPARTIEWHDYPDEDRRPMLAAAVAGGIVLLLLIPIIFDLLALAREGHLPDAPTPPDAEAAEGFEPLLSEDRPRPALPEPASV